jgi:DNA polymerase
VGEQPGDREDVAGRPFVGPAGGLLDRALAEAGIDRDHVYLTNAVKHFKWRPGAGGKKRLHDKPGWTEVRACLPWLTAEIGAVRPEVLVLMGATAAQALLGRDARVTALRGKPIEHELAAAVVVTAHPSSVLRARDEPSRREAFAALVVDLEVAAGALRRTGAA